MTKNNLLSMIRRFKSNDNVAYYDFEREMTFSELYLEMVMIMNYFESINLTQGKKVVSFLDKSFSEYALFYACLLKGVTFCPVDKSLPADRLAMIMSDLQPDMIMAEDAYIGEENTFRQKLSIPHECRVSNGCVSALTDAYADDEEHVADIDIDTVAYIIFTSGSTGKPKGVQITHENLNFFLDALYPRYVSEQSENYLSIGPLYFDMTILDSIVPPLYGHSVYLYKAPFIPGIFSSIIEKYQITRLSCVPSVLKMLLPQLNEATGFEQLNSLNLILFGAERPHGQSIRRLLENIPDLKVINAYGPTEGTMCCFSSEITLDSLAGDISIGKPFDGTRYLLETRSGFSTSGEGKLLISGKQVMKGYINKAQADNAFIVVGDDRYYCTNDVVKVDDDGVFYFLGRSDDEVKLNGFRVHLQDVAENIKATLNVGDLFLHKLTDNNKDYLVISYDNTSLLNPEECILSLGKRLPKYMIPNIFAIFDSLPKLKSSKLDRNKIKDSVSSELIRSKVSLANNKLISLQIK
ncbi:Plipastatin synthase subunit D [Serratia plymuthica]|uniref:AMP-binding protein n=1 Tax=Serratia plymuthica TaxID=82996 RepID=UPI000345FBCB|nr:AMP-binding protein [Serratia plymuthica]QJW54945.1 Plipastatin synthase subunit D [Serratia plymuthica]